jgi:hypothetical protein
MLFPLPPLGTPPLKVSMTKKGGNNGPLPGIVSVPQGQYSLTLLSTRCLLSMPVLVSSALLVSCVCSMILQLRPHRITLLFKDDRISFEPIYHLSARNRRNPLAFCQPIRLWCLIFKLQVESQTLLPEEILRLGSVKLGCGVSKASKLLYSGRTFKAVLCCTLPDDMTPVMVWCFSTPVSHLMHGRKGDKFIMNTCVPDNVRSVATH